jgi:hypothetical protein
MGMALVDLSSKDDRRQIDPFVDEKGCLRCMLGQDGGPEKERREIVGVHEYWGDMPFNEKFPFFGMVSMRDFVGRFCESRKLDNLDEFEIIRLKRHYGVLIQAEKDVGRGQ